ncbi:MAG: hypothetical protein HZB42_07905 [Sphingobacteriales bacterium]|nr:hypothetical protein [Sphingobacteriales bacterium]
MDEKSAKAFFTDAKYYCLDVHKDFQYKQTETTYKFASFEIALPHVYNTRTPINFYHSRHWNIKEIPIRAGPAIAANTLRGPPSC